jgi:hypothetical protein
MMIQLQLLYYNPLCSSEPQEKLQGFASLPFSYLHKLEGKSRWLLKRKVIKKKKGIPKTKQSMLKQQQQHGQDASRHQGIMF